MVVTLLPLERSVEVEPGKDLYQSLAKAGIMLGQSCGGKGICGKCRVRYQSQGPPPGPADLAHLSAEEIRAGIRLACSHTPPHGATLELTAEAIPLPAKLDLAAGTFTVDPWPDLGENDLMLALDLGTTNVVGYLLNPHSGRTLQATSLLNSQSVFGADVMTRLAHASLHGPAAQREMQRLSLNDLSKLFEPWRHGKKKVKHIVAVMNTAMTSLLLGWDPDVLGRHPCKAQEEGPIHWSPPGLGGALAGARMHLPPVMGGFVGSDTVAALWVALAEKPRPPFALIDIGTNAEVALVREDGGILCCSCAAGPAFEGGGISSGMRAANGAIDHAVARREKIDFSVIGNGEPRGIAGSGMLSLVASLVRIGALDGFGAFVPSALDRCMMQTGPGGRELRIHHRIGVSEQDIQQFMLAKAAAAAGLETLMTHARVEADDVGRLFLCGTFADHLDADDVLTIGLVPSELAPRIKSLGNAATLGAVMMACSQRDFREASRLATKAELLNLSGSSRFKAAFENHMCFLNPPPSP